MKRTLPSVRRKLAPPECRLPNAPFIPQVPPAEMSRPGGVLIGFFGPRKFEPCRNEIVQTLKEELKPEHFPTWIPYQEPSLLYAVSPTAMVLLVPSVKSWTPCGRP